MLCIEFCFASVQLLKIIYFSYFHPVMLCGIIFWGNSTNHNKVFLLQKKIITIMAGAQRSESCRSVFKRFCILMLGSECMFVLMAFKFGKIIVSQIQRFLKSILDTDIISTDQLPILHCTRKVFIMQN
jgi:hypothetical protein